MDGQPAALHGESVDLTVVPRKLNIEGKLDNQLDRIGYLRSIGENWQESLFHMRDLVVGLEDDEFWTGYPAMVDKDSLTEAEKKEYEERGWNNVEMDVELTADENGDIYEEPCPNPVQLSKMLRMILALLARQGMSWRSMVNDEIPTQITGDDD